MKLEVATGFFEKVACVNRAYTMMMLVWVTVRLKERSLSFNISMRSCQVHSEVVSKVRCGICSNAAAVT